MRTRSLFLKSAAVLALAAAAASPALAVTASSSAYDASVNITAAGLAGPIALGPINPVGGSAAPSYNLSNSIVSFSDSETGGVLGLPADTLTVTTGTLNSAASSSYPATQSATASASIQNLAATLTSAGVTLFSLRALTIASMSTANMSGATGSSTLQGVTVGGTLVGGPFTLSIPTNPTANDVVYNSGGLKITLNEQSPLGADGISTNAVDIMFTRFPVGRTAFNGNVILSHSQAQLPSAVPEPATWVELLAGFGALGLVARRRRVAVAA